MFQLLTNTEFLPRGVESDLAGTICGIGLEHICNGLMSIFVGQSKNQINTVSFFFYLCSSN